MASYAPLEYAPLEIGSFTAVTADRLELGEGPRLLADGTVVCVDILTGRLLRVPDTDGGTLSELARLHDPLGAVAPVSPVEGSRSRWAAATGMAFAALDSDGQVVHTADLLARPGGAQRTNDAACDATGRMWAGTMAYDATPGEGALHRWDTDGSVTCVLDGLTIPNGPVFSPDGRTLYLADSAQGVVEAFTVDTSSGELSERRVVFRVDAAEGSPDGMTVDSEGCIWSAIWGGGHIRRYTPDGELLQRIDVPARQPSAVCLTGRHLIVTTAAHGMTTPGPWDGAVLRATCRTAAPSAAPYSPTASELRH
ncbi:SMP-30/gluconolactonase/LRE family protein [Streptomyces sp. NPDC002795]|uniref:SMP-30/gluconolactonase/LRE family protein n=1 Tax=Streptomyces sp. NPDC002795 TaxID=3364665 RepID=UPI003687FF64